MESITEARKSQIFEVSLGELIVNLNIHGIFYLLRCVLPLNIFYKSKEICSEVGDGSYIVYNMDNTELLQVMGELGDQSW